MDRVEITVAATPEEAASLVDRGEMDVMSEPAPAAIAQRYLDDATLGERINIQPSMQLRYIAMNVALPPLEDDVRVRRAVSLVLDRAAMAATLTSQRGILTQVAQRASDALENNLLVSYAPISTLDDHGDLAAARAEMRLSAYDVDGDGMCDGPTCAGLPLMGAEVERLRTGTADRRARTARPGPDPVGPQYVRARGPRGDGGHRLAGRRTTRTVQISRHSSGREETSSNTSTRPSSARRQMSWQRGGMR